MQIWPAIDLRGGKCVRLRQGDYDRETVFGDDPSEVAARWVAQGANRLHLVDLDGAREGVWTNQAAIRSILRTVDVPCQLGGGIRDQATIEQLLALGLQQLVIGTKALKQPQWFREMCHAFPGRLAVGIDARSGRIATEGWRETSETAALDLARTFVEEPLAAIIYTDIDRDGMMQGPNVAAMAEMNESVPTPVIASGGVTSAADVRQLAELDLAGCIIGRSLYEGTLSLADALTAASE